jgi:hypothetical protein
MTTTQVKAVELPAKYQLLIEAMVNELRDAIARQEGGVKDAVPPFMIDEDKPGLVVLVVLSP